MTETAPSVLFIHGLWLHATSWTPWIELYTEAGYGAQAPGWPGDPDTVAEARANPESIADHGIDDVVEHYAGIIAAMAVPPILVGHSFGGMIAQRLLGQGLASAAVAIDAAQIKGVLPLPLSALRATLPVFRNPTCTTSRTARTPSPSMPAGARSPTTLSPGSPTRNSDPPQFPTYRSSRRTEDFPEIPSRPEFVTWICNCQERSPW
jgi:pimeloyl-ACP methyl ester carboxylesterase